LRNEKIDLRGHEFLQDIALAATRGAGHVTPQSNVAPTPVSSKRNPALSIEQGREGTHGRPHDGSRNCRVLDSEEALRDAETKEKKQRNKAGKKLGRKARNLTQPTMAIQQAQGATPPARAPLAQ
jgi:hypothetical protein